MVFPLQEEECANHAHERHEKVSICSEEPACASHPSANGAEMHLLRAHRLCDGSSADAYGLGQQDVATEFISGRPNDNIGLTIFAGEAFTQCPMTTDHASLLRLLQATRTDIAARGLIDDGTAVGMGLANAVSRLKDSKSKSKVVILLTDGSNNMGEISPMTAAEIAKSYGIRVYTIGVGTNKVAPYPMPVAGGVQYVNIPVEIDTKTLSDIAQTTDGNFYRATNNNELKKIYKDIDKLEKTKFNVKHFAKRYEAYQPFALAALLVLLVEILLRITWFRRIP